MTEATRRCAVYTRKSSEEGLGQEFNSLHAQREACEAYIKSQKHEGWQLVKTDYDDGGFSGGNIERPGLQKLLEDIEAKKIDVVVVYKVDRLTRALSDFAKIIERFDKHGVSFVSVTQQFNTTSSMGRLTLNVLLSFAQFEREVTGERIRDKIAASKQKGMWMGGTVPLGYDAVNQKLIINIQEAETVRYIFSRYLELGCVRLLQEEIRERGIRSKIREKSVKSGGGNILSRGTIYKMLSNSVYIGRVRHKDMTHSGQHEPILDEVLWQQVQEHLLLGAGKKGVRGRKTQPSPLIGKLFDAASGERLTSDHANKKGKRYRYYVLAHSTEEKNASKAGWRLPAKDIEQLIAQVASRMLTDKAAVSGALQQAQIPPQQIASILNNTRDYRNRLRAETCIPKALRELVERVELRPDGFTITLTLKPLMDDESNLQPKMIRNIAMQIKRRGIETKLIVEGARALEPDKRFIYTVARAKAWFDDIITKKLSVHAIATREGCNETYIAALMPLAFLAPDIVEAIVAGKHPIGLTKETLTKKMHLPFEWDAQRKAIERY